MAIVISGNGIDMGGNPVSNASQIDSTVINENGDNVTTTSDLNTAGIALKTIATGTATFTATTNNINLTGIGIGVEIGDVIQISGANNAKNNSEFTVEVITDDNNVIVNQAHANKGTTKNVANRSGDTGVTVKLLAKWYNAPIGLGQDWVDMTANRSLATTYPNNTNRAFAINLTSTLGSANVSVTINNLLVYGWGTASGNINVSTGNVIIPNKATYLVIMSNVGILTWLELR